MSGLILDTPPSVEPVSVAEARDQLVIQHTEDGDLIGRYIVAAREAVENYTARALIVRTYVLQLEYFPHVISLPRPPLLTVDDITYFDEAGVLQTVEAATYEVDEASTLGRIRPIDGESWPATARRFDAVKVKYQAGYGAAGDDVPMSLRQSLLIQVGDLYEHREDIVIGASVNMTNASKALAHPWRVVTM